MHIDNFHVVGFRSLNDITIGRLRPINIIYGNNNSGKSNILAALETFFKVENIENLESPVGTFLNGELSNFVDNFTINANGEKAKKIQMSLRLLLNDNDLQRLPIFFEFIKKNEIYEKGHQQRIQFEVEIIQTTTQKATRSIIKASVNRKVMYDVFKSGPDRFFPEITQKKPSIANRQSSVEELLLSLINLFSLINAGRFLQSELLSQEPVSKLAMQQFKNFILCISQGRGEEYEIFQRIREWFNNEPFRYGLIRPIIEGKNVGLAIEDGSKKELVIERLGTGVHQILILLSYLSCSKSRIIGIEELELNLSPSLQDKMILMLREIVAKSRDMSIDQFILTSHSMHLAGHEETVLYAVSMDGTGNTQIKRGPKALKEHFDYGLYRISRKRLKRI